MLGSETLSIVIVLIALFATLAFLAGQRRAMTNLKAHNDAVEDQLGDEKLLDEVRRSVWLEAAMMSVIIDEIEKIAGLDPNQPWVHGGEYMGGDKRRRMADFMNGGWGTKIKEKLLEKVMGIVNGAAASAAKAAKGWFGFG